MAEFNVSTFERNGVVGAVCVCGRIGIGVIDGWSRYFEGLLIEE